MKKRKWWAVPAVLLTIILVLAAVFWQTLILYIAPKMVLAAALRETVADLESRISGSPIPVLARGIDPEGKQTIGLQLDTHNDLMGTIHYDLDVKLQTNPTQVLASGKVAVQKKEMDISLYLDREFAAISSEGILGGAYYGLTYDTFPQDIRSNKVMAMLIGESVLQNWELKIQMLQDVMDKELPDLPDFSDIDFKSLSMGILALDADVDPVRMDVNGHKETYHVISFETTGEEIASGLAYLGLEADNLPDADEEVKFSFWLTDREIIKAEITGDGKKLDIYWGGAPISAISEGDIYVEYFDGQRFRSCHISGHQQEGLYQETIRYVGASKVQISYDWIPSTGYLELSVDTKGERTDLALKLLPLESGFAVATDDFGMLMHLLLGTPDAADNPCTMTVTKGAQLAIPLYKNFTDWSAEDLLMLLSGFGGLLGLKLP